jgi:hypothetical protein
MTLVDTLGGGYELIQDVNDIRNVRMIASGVLKNIIVCGMKTSVKLHRSDHGALISKICTITKIMNVLSLGVVVAVRCGCDLDRKKVVKRTQVRHVKLLTEASLNKGNILLIIPHDEHIIHIGKNKGTIVRGSANKKSRIMLSSNKANNSDNQN